MSRPTLDREALVELLDGNAELVVRIINSFLDDCPDYLEGIREAIEKEDGEQLEREAHGLKGSAGSIRAKPASDAAAELETIGHSGDFSNAEPALETLEEEISKLTDELLDLKSEVQE